MKLRFLGAAQTVTGSCYLIDTGKTKLLVDCGLYQGPKEIKERNYGEFPFNPAEIDFVCLTHAHTDHSGLLPKLARLGFKGQILATTPTIDLCNIMLPDSGHIQEMEVERKNRKASRSGKALLQPIYTVRDAAETMKYFRPAGYRETIQLTPEIRVRFQDSGHILGSASLEIWVTEAGKEAKIVFSGDLGNTNLPIVNEPTTITDADYIVVESTYGDRDHDRSRSRLDLLQEVIQETYDRGGKLLIPSFAIERTQDLLYELAQLFQQKLVPDIDIYIDSPLAIAATEVFMKNMYYFDDEAKGFFTANNGVFSLPNLHYSRRAEESMALNSLPGRAIIIAGSGMADAGRIKHHLKHNLWRKETTVLFVGFQAEGTLGRRLLEGEKQVRIHGEEITVRANIRNVPGFSGHADRSGLINWLTHFQKPPKTLFITHGEPEAMKNFSGLIRQQLGWKTHIPAWLEEVPLLAEQPAEAPAAAAAVTPTSVLPSVGDLVTPEAAERAYLQLRMLLRELVEEEMDRHEYARLLEHFKELEKVILSMLGRPLGGAGGGRAAG
ncbi:MBL fold metallo-hydrolase [Heliobacterium undosum]|uniref:MBL fold metallo-hydrolase n=1 Tax=Heliomicrobium undosum TaxID=121734 RepID=A0A845L190_9FIRM|nr:MBL fold metallo-hydrolase [Heliomicrobium undosum]MZP28729.1 MBL fold metallo-hydrolase [Heliomicrobium undosum]